MLRSLTILPLVWLFLSKAILAHELPAAPEPKTIRWTLNTAQASIIPHVDLDEGITARKAIKHLDDTDGWFAGYYLNIDASAVEDRLDTRIVINEKDISWLAFLGIVVDRLDAMLVVEPGVFRIVSREAKVQDPKKTTNKPE